MNDIWWQTEGKGGCHLVLLHGWGLNAEVWHCIREELASHFTLHLVDLPGYGRSRSAGVMSLDEMAACVAERAPARAVWLGWSLGGLVASTVALHHPERVQALVTVASSPCFIAHDDWPGIRPAVLDNFQHQLRHDFQRTVERFLALQTVGTERARQDRRLLKKVVLMQPMASLEVLKAGLAMLKTTDLREVLCDITVPFLRLYGRLDGLVLRAIAAILDKRLPHSMSQVFPHAAHAPFMSDSESFCKALVLLRSTMTN